MRPYLAALAFMAMLVAALAAATVRSGESSAENAPPRQTLPRLLEAPPSSPAEQTATTQQDPTTPELGAEPSALRTARNEEMAARRQLTEQEIANLASQLGSGLSAQEELEIHRRIARAKDVARLDLLDIQARYARLAGHESAAVELEATVKARRDALDDRSRAGVTPAPTVPQKAGR